MKLKKFENIAVAEYLLKFLKSAMACCLYEMYLQGIMVQSNPY